MALPMLCSPVPEISVEAKRELPDFQIEEERARSRIRNPEIKRPVRPMYHLVRHRTPDLEIQDTTDEMVQWAELRKIMLAQTIHPRWVGSIAVGNTIHTIAWYMVAPQAENSGRHYCTLRCSCSLPSVDEPDSTEYAPCAAKDSVILERALAYRTALGIDEHLSAIKGGLTDLLGNLISEVKNDHLIWPPSHRSDALLVDGLSATFGVSPKKIMDAALPLEENKVVRIHDTDHPTIALAA